MRFKSLTNRLTSLESKNQSSGAMLKFADGSSRGIVLVDPLGVLLIAMRERSRQIGPPEGAESDPRPANVPASRHDAAIALIGAAESVESHDVFMHLVHETCKSVAEAKPNANLTAAEKSISEI